MIIWDKNCISIFYMLKDSKARKVKYQEIIDNLTDKIGIVDIIKQDVDYIKNKKS